MGLVLFCGGGGGGGNGGGGGGGVVSCLFAPRLADILGEQDKNTARNQFHKLHKQEKNERVSTVFEVRQLDHLCLIALGNGLAQFKPAYFQSGVVCMKPGSVYDGLLPRQSTVPRKLLRLVADREKTGSGAQSFLCSRLRALEVCDPHH